MKLKGVDLTVSLESLSFYLARGEMARPDNWRVTEAPAVDAVPRSRSYRGEAQASERGGGEPARIKMADSRTWTPWHVTMVDVGDKAVTAREAIARGSITMSAEALSQIRAGSGEEGRSAAGGAPGRHHGGEADLRAHPAVPSAADLARRPST